VQPDARVEMASSLASSDEAVRWERADGEREAPARRIRSASAQNFSLYATGFNAPWHRIADDGTCDATCQASVSAWNMFGWQPRSEVLGHGASYDDAPFESWTGWIDDVQLLRGARGR